MCAPRATRTRVWLRCSCHCHGMLRPSFLLFFLLSFSLSGCGDSPSVDGGSDAGPGDSSVTLDATPSFDAGARDAAQPLDSSMADARERDAAERDAMLDATNDAMPTGVDAGPSTSGRNLEGSHTDRVSSPCTLFVANDGNDGNDGDSPSEAFASSSHAVSAAGPGDVVCFAAGRYETLRIRELEGSATSPIVFRAAPGDEGDAIFSSGDVGRGHGVLIEASAYIHVYDIGVRESQKGLDFMSSHYGRIEGVHMERLGQEGIHIGRKRTYDGSNRFLGSPSDHVDVIGNHVSDTGVVTAIYSEGIYVGQGALGGDTTHHVFIAYNHIEDVGAEGIELKPYAHDIVVRGNLIVRSSHEYNGAIVVAVEPTDCPDGNYLIEDNRIYDFQSRRYNIGGIVIGHGSGIVRNNLVWSVEGGRGIRVYRTFGNSSARTLQIVNNTIWNPGSEHSVLLNNGNTGTGETDIRPNLTVENNLTDDGSAGTTQGNASMFVGPVEGAADVGEGVGSGFEQVDYRGVGADLIPLLVD